MNATETHSTVDPRDLLPESPLHVPPDLTKPAVVIDELRKYAAGLMQEAANGGDCCPPYFLTQSARTMEAAVALLKKAYDTNAATTDVPTVKKGK